MKKILAFWRVVNEYDETTNEICLLECVYNPETTTKKDALFQLYEELESKNVKECQIKIIDY